MGWLKESLMTSTTAVHLGFWIYLVLGATVYYFIENPLHSAQPARQVTVNESFCQILTDDIVNETLSDNSTQIHGKWLEKLKEKCHDLTGIRIDDNSNGSSSETDITWEFSSALFLTMTIVTTIGYGSFAPLSEAGKVFTIVFGFFGIPLCGLLLARTSDSLSSLLLRIYEKRRQRDEKRRGILAAAFLFLLPGLGLFIFIPAVIFTFNEQWTYLEAVYFSFVTLTTIGFGDIVIGTSHPNPQWLWFYRVSWVVWVYLGIAYWAVIISFITKAFKSKKLRDRWNHTIKLISHEAHAVSKQLSPSHHHGSFVASTTKTAFDFALHLTGAVGRMESELNETLGPSLPGIATALKPVPGKGLMALIQLSAGMLGQKPHEPPKQMKEPAEEPAGIKRESIVYKAAISTDSGIAVDIDNTDNDNGGQPKQRSRAGSVLAKTDSTVSLPLSLEKPVQNQNNNANKRKFLKSHTRPELKRVPTMDKQTMEGLILQAMMILQEAHARGSSLDLAHQA